jgi:hypothetical protein
MERPGGRVPHHHSDPCSADFCQPAGRRRCLTDLCCRRVADNAGIWDASIYCGAFILRLCPLLEGKADMAIALRNVRL